MMKVSSGPQVGCCSHPLNSGFLSTILLRGGAFEREQQPDLVNYRDGLNGVQTADNTNCCIEPLVIKTRYEKSSRYLITGAKSIQDNILVFPRIRSQAWRGVSAN